MFVSAWLARRLRDAAIIEDLRSPRLRRIGADGSAWRRTWEPARHFRGDHRGARADEGHARQRAAVLQLDESIRDWVKVATTSGPWSRSAAPHRGRVATASGDAPTAGDGQPLHGDRPAIGSEAPGGAGCAWWIFRPRPPRCAALERAHAEILNVAREPAATPCARDRAALPERTRCATSSPIRQADDHGFRGVPHVLASLERKHEDRRALPGRCRSRTTRSTQPRRGPRARAPHRVLALRDVRLDPDAERDLLAARPARAVREAHDHAPGRRRALALHPRCRARRGVAGTATGRHAVATLPGSVRRDGAAHGEPRRATVVARTTSIARPTRAPEMILFARPDVAGEISRAPREADSSPRSPRNRTARRPRQRPTSSSDASAASSGSIRPARRRDRGTACVSPHRPSAEPMETRVKQSLRDVMHASPIKRRARQGIDRHAGFDDVTGGGLPCPHSLVGGPPGKTISSCSSWWMHAGRSSGTVAFEEASN